MRANDWSMPYYPALFHLEGEVQDWTHEKFEWVNQTIHGRIAGTWGDAAVLVQAAKNAGNGDYLEIGSLFGGSAILVALAKKEFGREGRVACIDDGAMAKEFEDHRDFIPENAELAGVELEWIRSKSNPWPLDYSRKFACVYVDASHDYGNCIQDWKNARVASQKYVVFHDYDNSHPGVMTAVREAANEWPIVHLSEHTVVLERKNG